jgi:hypothetical protein
MPTISFEMSAEHLTRLVNALCESHGYQATIDGQPNPETKAVFAKKIAANILRNIVRQWENDKARQEAVVNVTDITLI